jgi:lysophospholipase L1-like esterase
MDTLFCILAFVSLAGLSAGAEPLKVFCFGDSTTAPRQGVVTYCESLQKEYSTGDRATLFNRGVPGNTTADAKAQFDRDVLSLQPDLVFILFGINDSAIDVWKIPPADRPRVSLEDYRANLRLFVDKLQATGARVVLLTFNPVHWTPKLQELYGRPPYRPDDADGFDVGRAEYLKAIQDVATEKRVRLVDVNSAYRSYAAAPGHKLQDLLLDGIHPNSLGHTITTSLVRPIVESALKEKGQQ